MSRKDQEAVAATTAAFRKSLAEYENTAITQDIAVWMALQHLVSAQTAFEHQKYIAMAPNPILALDFQARVALAGLWTNIATQLKDYPDGVRIEE